VSGKLDRSSMRVTHRPVAKTIRLTVLVCEPIENTVNFFAIVLNVGTTHHAHVLSVCIDLRNYAPTNTARLLIMNLLLLW
jgi:hypothetical protein